MNNMNELCHNPEHKNLEEKLIAARHEAEAAHRLTKLVMANMNHEIRTPLNAILGFTNLLVRADLQPELKEYAGHIMTAGMSLLAIVKDILDFEKICSGVLRIDPVPFDLHELLQSIIMPIRSSAREKGLDLRLDAGTDLPRRLVGDPTRLTQVLSNLLGNAVKFTESGHVTLRVRLLPGPGDVRLIRFEVEDTGIGIPEAKHRLIFEHFTQSSSGTTREYGGTGLGLAIVKMIVELQDGAISLNSEVGRGSTFAVEIPFQTAPPQQIAPEVAPLIEIDALPDLSGYHVLLVEDNVMNRRIAELHLREFGLEVTNAGNGREAVELLQVNPDKYDLVCMDIEMPEMDGYTATRTIRSELGLTDLPIVAVTAHVFAGERQKVIASGMNDYLTKPVGHQEVITLLLRYLSDFWNPDAMREYTFDKPDHIKEIAELFNRLFPQDLAILETALQQKDFAEVVSRAHNLRSTVSYAGFGASLGKFLQEIESQASVETPDPVVLLDLYTGLARDGNYAMWILQHEFLKGN